MRKTNLAVVTGIAIAGLIVACAPSDDAAPAPTIPAVSASRATGPTASSNAEVPASTTSSVQIASRGRTPAERRASVAWVGQLHTEAVSDLTRNEAHWRAVGGGWDRAGRCRAVKALTEKYMARVQREQRTLLGLDRHKAALMATQAAPACAGAGALSIFGSSATAAVQYQYSPEDGEPVTGAYEDYLPALESAVNSAWSATQVTSNVNAVLASVSGLPDPDLQVLYAAAELAISSNQYWYEFEVSGQMDEALRDRGSGGPSMYTIFPVQAPRWRVIGAADLFGCAAGAADKAWLSAGGPVGWKIIAGACAVWGIGGSAATWAST